MVGTTITLAFADGSYDFGLGLEQIHEIQKRCNAGIGAVYARVLKGRLFKVTPTGDVAMGDPLQAEYRLEDILAVIRQGLIGGGRGRVDGQEVNLDAGRISDLIDNYVLAAPLKDGWALAATILSAAIEGYEPPEDEAETVKKKDGRETDGSITAKL